MQSVQVCGKLPLNLCESAYLVKTPRSPCGTWVRANNCCPCIPCNQFDGGACQCWKLDCISNYDAKELWPIFKAKFHKSYAPWEDQRRFNVFKQVVEEAAKKGNKFTVTELADAIFPKN